MSEDKNKANFLETLKEYFEHPFLHPEAVIEPPFEELDDPEAFDAANGNFVIDLFLFRMMCDLTPAIYYELGDNTPYPESIDLVILKDNPQREVKYSTLYRKYIKYENYPAFRYTFKVVKRSRLKLEQRPFINGVSDNNLVVSLPTVKLKDYYDLRLHELQLEQLTEVLREHSEYFFELIGRASRYPRWDSSGKGLVWPDWNVFKKWE